MNQTILEKISDAVVSVSKKQTYSHRVLAANQNKIVINAELFSSENTRRINNQTMKKSGIIVCL